MSKQCLILSLVFQSTFIFIGSYDYFVDCIVSDRASHFVKNADCHPNLNRYKQHEDSHGKEL